MTQPIKIIGVIKEEVGRPRADGTPGSALYEVPFRLSDRPSARWAEIFVHTWNRPPRFTTMHRPGIASVTGDRIILDGTTMEEVENYHLETLKLCVEGANEQEARLAEQDRIREKREQAEAEAHQREVEDIADRLEFD